MHYKKVLSVLVYVMLKTNEASDRQSRRYEQYQPILPSEFDKYFFFLF